MTLKEYLESYDESLNEGIGENIKNKLKLQIKKTKESFKNFKENFTSKIKNNWNAFLNNTNDWVRFLSVAFSTLLIVCSLNSWADKADYRDAIRELETEKNHLSYIINRHYNYNVSPEIMAKYDRQLKAANDALQKSSQQLEKISTVSELTSEKEIDKTLNDIKLCIQLTRKTITEIDEQANNDDQSKEFHKWKENRFPQIHVRGEDKRNWFEKGLTQENYKKRKY